MNMKSQKGSAGVGLVMLLFVSACDTLLDLEPLDAPSEPIFFETPQHFKAFSNDFYGHLSAYAFPMGDYMDFGTDLTAMPQPYGQGAIVAQGSDGSWTGRYQYIRATNKLLAEAAAYEGDASDIEPYVGAAHFFRAWHYFFLLQRFGGVPIVTEVLDLGSEQLYTPRNTRYEVFDQILVDLDAAIERLPEEQAIPSADRGKVSRQAAQAFKARALLFEATWEKYVGESTDWEPGQTPAGGNRVHTFLDEAARMAWAVMTDGPYELFNPPALGDLSLYYLFVLEDAMSNPAGLTKADNREYILKSNFDYALRQTRVNISHTAGGRLAPSRKMMDLYLCTDGLPPAKSSAFQGYSTIESEYQNRSNRLRSWVKVPGQMYWGWGEGVGGGGANWNEGFPPDWGTHEPVLTGTSSGGYGSGYEDRKWVTSHAGRETYEESYDYPHIRLAEVLLIYAEAVYERDGAISDADLDLSIGRLRARAGVAPLTNTLVNSNGLDMLEEIRNERARELFGEGFRFSDLRRWAIAEEALGMPIRGAIVDGTEYETMPLDRYDPGAYPYGTDSDGALILDPASNRNFSKTHYLFAIPLDQLNLNPELAQNPGWPGS